MDSLNQPDDSKVDSFNLADDSQEGPRQVRQSLDRPPEVTLTTAGMTRVGARPPLGEYIRSLWDRRHFIVSESRGKAYGTVRDTFLGKVWLILEPFLNSAVYYVIFGLVLNMSRGVPNFLGYLVVGVTFFGILSKHLGGAANIISSGKPLIKAFAFPRAALVLSFSLRQYIDFLPSIIAAIIFILVIPPHVAPTWTWLLMPLALLLGIPFCLGMAFITATFTTLIPDMKFIWPLITRFWFYASGVFWSVDRFAADSTIALVMHVNPGWVYLEIMRESLVYGRVPGAELWLYFGIWSVAVFVIGFLLFWSQEEKFSNYDA